jgi:hypothetical protein
MDSTQTQDAVMATDPPAGRAGVRGAAIGFAFLTLGVTVLGLLEGASFGGALGMGVFVGIFGGWGVGGYLGASLCLSIAQGHAADDARRIAHAVAEQHAAQPDASSTNIRSVGIDARQPGVTMKAS